MLELDITTEMTKPFYLGSDGPGLPVLPAGGADIILNIEQPSPSLLVEPPYYCLLLIVVTQWPIKEFFRRVKREGASFRCSLDDLINGMVAGDRNMIGIGVATATLTCTALFSIILGTVLPTTASQLP